MAGARSGQMWDCLIEKNKPGNHGRPQGGGKTGICLPWKLGLRSKNFWKTWNQEFKSDYLG